MSPPLNELDNVSDVPGDTDSSKRFAGLSVRA